jgi:hypothetical protein
MDIKMNYVFFSAVSTSSTIASAYVFRLNDTYDPDYTGVGHQPMYRDQMFALYDIAVPYACDYHTLISTTSVNPLYTIAQVTRSSAVAADISETAERGESQLTKVVTQNKPASFSGSVDIAQRFGITRAQLFADDLNSQGPAAVPTNVLYMNMSFVDATASGTTAYLHTRLTLHVRFRRLKEISQS